MKVGITGTGAVDLDRPSTRPLPDGSPGQRDVRVLNEAGHARTPLIAPCVRYDRPGSVEQVHRAVLFTDVAGSTALYDRLGDFRAFTIITNQIDVQRSLIEREYGHVTKALGDGVMATFSSSVGALKAAIAIHHEARKEGVQVRIGIHAGHCLTNETGDCFGQTINLASRIQTQSSGDDICVTPDVLDGSSHIQPILDAASIDTTMSTVHLRGVEDPVTLYRLTPRSWHGS